MTNPFYTISRGNEFSGASIILSDGTTIPVSDTHPKWDSIVEALLSGADESVVFDLASPFEAIFRNLTKLSDRVARMGNTLYFDGDAINTGIARAIIKSLDEEGVGAGQEATWRAYVAFLEKLATNPSRESQEHLYYFVEKHGLTILPDGDLVGYKGVDHRHKSTTAGYGIVTTPDGVTTTYEKDYLPNEVGYVVEIPRSMVDTNRNEACSTGLHSGSWAYASNHAPVLLTVKINPRDVVSVPADSNDQKIRSSRYEVIGINEDKRQFRPGVVSMEEASASTQTHTKSDSRVEEYKAVITSLLADDPGFNLKRFRNKSITSKRRPEFDQAAIELGLVH